tara:strand:+ start:4276 stop:5298 length:1023 start_codon:yes stop_codon:yes gene_type:complete
MSDYYFLFFVPLLIFFFIFLSQKYSILNSFSGDAHQKFVEKDNVPLIGGIFILLGFILIFYSLYLNFLILSILIFSLGIFSDLKIIKSPQTRFILQIISILIFIYFNNFLIFDTRIFFLNEILENKYFNYLFALFCLTILVNGSNFIDGLNTLLIGYYLVVSFFLLKTGLIGTIGFEIEIFYKWFLLLVFLYFFNFFKKIFMGDSGAYLLGLIYGFFIIKIHQNNPLVSPFFIILMLWYPCFELLFSIIRKITFNKSPLKPDNKHFHQIVFLYIRKIFKLKNQSANSLSGNLINLYNFLIIFWASQKIYDTQFQIILIILNIIIYVFIYVRIFNRVYKIK